MAKFEKKPVVLMDEAAPPKPLDPFEAMEQFEKVMTDPWRKYVPVMGQILSLWQYEKEQAIEAIKRAQLRGRL